MDLQSAVTPADVQVLGAAWYEKFNRLAGDLYPGKFTRLYCDEAAVRAFEIRQALAPLGGMVVSHSYQDPALHEVAHFVGDSLGLAQKVLAVSPAILHFSSVHFMAETAKCFLGDRTRVFVQGPADVHSCSLVEGTSHEAVRLWKLQNPTGVLVTYVNSDLLLKTMSDYICTSSNAAEVIRRAHEENPQSQILLLPDKFLGAVMKAKAFQKYGVPLEQVEIYTHRHQSQFRGKLKVWNASCYVHDQIGDEAPEEALDRYPGAILMLHPECGCANSCMYKLQQGLLPQDRVIYESTEGMLRFVQASQAKSFIVGTEIGMIYRLRQMCPDREFHPISLKAKCDFMKENTIQKLHESVVENKYELVLDDNVAVGDNSIVNNCIRINRAAAAQANVAIHRMLTTKAA